MESRRKRTDDDINWRSEECCFIFLWRIEHLKNPYMSTFFVCPLQDPVQKEQLISLLTEHKKVRVSVVTSSKDADQIPKDTNSVPLKVSAWDGKQEEPHGITVCLKAVTAGVGANHIALLEFLAHYKNMGVDHVMLYNHSTSAETNCLLAREKRNVNS